MTLQDGVRAASKREYHRNYWRSNKARYAEYRKFEATRRAAARARFTSPFGKRPAASVALFAAFEQAADTAIFQSEEGTLAWCAALPDTQMAELFAAGVNYFIAQMRMSVRERVGADGLGGAMERLRTKSGDSSRRRDQTVRVFKHIIEKLDDHTVDGKKLGDCTRPDLLRAAARLESEANEMTLDATLYRQFAAYPGMLKAGTRLRDLTPNDRRDSGMLKLLTQRWGEDEEAA